MKVLLPLVILVSACVTTGTYNRKVAELTKLRDDEVAAARQRAHTLDEKIADLQRTVSELQGAPSRLFTSSLPRG